MSVIDIEDTHDISYTAYYNSIHYKPPTNSNLIFPFKIENHKITAYSIVNEKFTELFEDFYTNVMTMKNEKNIDEITDEIIVSVWLYLYPINKVRSKIKFTILVVTSLFDIVPPRLHYRHSLIFYNIQGQQFHKILTYIQFL